MDSDQIPLEDLICNFDPDTFITYVKTLNFIPRLRIEQHLFFLAEVGSKACY